MPNGTRESATPIAAVLTDVDGTLLTREKELTPWTIRAVKELHDLGVHFAVTSGRPPRGMTMLIEPLALTGPMAAFTAASSSFPT